MADKISYKTSFRCGTNRSPETEAVLDALAPEVEVNVAQFMAIWEFGSYDDLSHFVSESHYLKFASEIAKKMVRRRWVVNI